MRLQAGAGRHLNILEIVMTASAVAVAVAGDDRDFNFNLPLYETAVIFVYLDTGVSLSVVDNRMLVDSSVAEDVVSTVVAPAAVSPDCRASAYWVRVPEPGPCICHPPAAAHPPVSRHEVRVGAQRLDVNRNSWQYSQYSVSTGYILAPALSLELQMKVIRRYAKMLQSRRRPLLGQLPLLFAIPHPLTQLS